MQLTKCEVCQRMNRKVTTGTPQLNPIPVKSPWYMVGIDFVGPISPAADDGSKYILTATDYFTKWSEAVPTVDKSAASVATALFKVRCDKIGNTFLMLLRTFLMFAAIHAYGASLCHSFR